MTAPHGVFGIYPILDAHRLADVPVDPEAFARVVASLGIGAVQLRCKAFALEQYLFCEAWLSCFRRLAPATRVIINDRADIALALGACGVHLGMSDLPPSAARRLLGPQSLVGLSTHNPAELTQAALSGADHAGFGPIFPTVSKPDADTPKGLSLLHEACRLTPLPVVAIGGIGVAEVGSIARAGAAAAAMISGLLTADWQSRLTQAVAAWREAKGAMESTPSPATGN